METLKIIWTNQAKLQLKELYKFYKEKSPQGAKNIKNDILKATKELVFSKQHQADEIEPSFRRIIVSHYKIIYKVDATTIAILRIFDTRQNPLNNSNN